jgi:hypothetical protein
MIWCHGVISNKPSSYCFYFLAQPLMSHSFHIQGISNAFVMHKVSFETQSLSLLNVFLTWMFSIIGFGLTVIDALFLVLLTIYTRIYGAFFATMAHLRVCFHIKQTCELVAVRR